MTGRGGLSKREQAFVDALTREPLRALTPAELRRLTTIELSARRQVLRAQAIAARQHARLCNAEQRAEADSLRARLRLEERLWALRGKPH